MDPGDPVAEAQAQQRLTGALALLVQLSFVRSMFLVGHALAKNFPDADDWQAMLDNQELQDRLVELEPMLQATRLLTQLGFNNEERFLSAMHMISGNSGERVRAVEAAADLLGVQASELLALIVHQ